MWSTCKRLPVGWEPSLRPVVFRIYLLEDIQYAQELQDGALIWAELTKENREKNSVGELSSQHVFLDGSAITLPEINRDVMMTG